MGTTHTVQTQPSAEAPDAERDTAMASAFAEAQQRTSAPATPAANAGTEARPDWLPEKFTSPQALVGAYHELERKLSTTRATEPAPDDAPDGAPDEAAGADDTAAQQAARALQAHGLDFTALSQEYADTGTLSETSYRALADKGYTRELVDSWIAGQSALSERLQSAIQQSVGGPEPYQQMVQWAASALTPDEIAAYNNALEHGEHAAKLAARGLFAQYSAANGHDGALITANTAAASDSGYRSLAQMQADMNDPRYQHDPAFQADVHRKIALSSNIF